MHRMNIVGVILIAFIILGKSCAVIQPHWKKYILWIVRQHESNMWAPVIINAPLPPPDGLQEVLDSDNIFLPDVIVWDPLKHYSTKIPQVPMKKTVGFP